jgi:hypothetical protein
MRRCAHATVARGHGPFGHEAEILGSQDAPIAAVEEDQNRRVGPVGGKDVDIFVAARAEPHIEKAAQPFPGRAASLNVLPRVDREVRDGFLDVVLGIDRRGRRKVSIQRRHRFRSPGSARCWR